MDQSLKKHDITSKVYGKMEAGHLAFFHCGKRIGRMHFTDQGTHYAMMEGFVFEGDKFYQLYKNVIIDSKART
ncbi:hypothetical protein A374_02794 [Fictibacillus macauensis ZFHKF-1]|uniref:Uncharacterized protein n=1 Tax=Fictibacillus macauensis ZFHKF-1 TaxID=1196324 RepID=I8J5R6_9BACL|nr:DUF2553 family protein [Fictibacillus macauensis]EIT87146.1 hypothetical protein A374_02794 [Fictibacillus macauensis ZFHKF-1]